MKSSILRLVLVMFLTAALSHLWIPVNHSEAEDLATKAETGKYCKVNVTQMIGRSAYDTLVEICPDGVVYKNDSMKKARTIGWSDVAQWQFIGPKTGADDLSEAHSVLRIVEKSGTAHTRSQLFFVICCTVSAGQKVYESMRSYHSAGEY
jgi:hypothetical protein